MSLQDVTDAQLRARLAEVDDTIDDLQTNWNAPASLAQAEDERDRIWTEQARRTKPKTNPAPAKKVYADSPQGRLQAKRDQLAEAEAALSKIGKVKFPTTHTAPDPGEREAAIAKGRLASSVADLRDETARLEARQPFAGLDSDEVADASAAARQSFAEARKAVVDARERGDGEAMTRANAQLESAMNQMRSLTGEVAERRHEKAIGAAIDHFAVKRVRRDREALLAGWEKELANREAALAGAVNSGAPYDQRAIGEARENVEKVRKIIRDNPPPSQAELQAAHQHLKDSPDITIRRDRVEVPGW